jgi:hypothetical protein
MPAGVHNALLMSEAVPRRIAAAAGQTIRVQGVYRSVVNFATSDGLLTVASSDTGALPNGIQVDVGSDWRMLGIQAGMAVHASLHEVRVPEASLEIRLDEARQWSPRLRYPKAVASPAAERWRRRRRGTWANAGRWASSGGFGPLFRRGRNDRDRSGIPEVARSIVATLEIVLLGGDRCAAARVAAGLIGLGPGLTPSGDDALIGIEAALHALGSPMAGFTAAALDDVEARTTSVAATLLRHAAAGETAERVHNLVAALLGLDDSAVATAMERAVAWGATSGTDCLFGVLVGLDIASVIRGPGH